MGLLRAIDANLTKDVVTSYDPAKTFVAGTMRLQTIEGEQCLAPDTLKYMDSVADTTLVSLMPERAGDYTFSVQGTATPFSVICYYAPVGSNTKTYLGRVNIATGSGTSVLRSLKIAITGSHTGANTVTLFILTTNATAANSGLYQTTQVTFADFTPAGTTITLAAAAETSALKRVFKHEEDGTNGGGGSHLMTAGNELFLDQPNGIIYVKNGAAGSGAWQLYKFKYDVLLTSTSATGQTTSGFTGVNGFKTGGIAIALGGAVLQNNSGKYAIPDANSGAVAPTLGNPCLTFATTTTLYHGLVSELAAGVTSWPSLTPINISGAAGDQVNPTAVGFANFSQVLGRWVFTSNGRYYFKRMVNNEIDFILGCSDSQFLETNPGKTPILGSVVVTGLDITDGVMTITSSTVGQRGMLSINVRNDARFDHSYFITPAMQLNNDTLTSLSIRNLLRGSASSSQVWYRVGSSLSAFSSATGGWLRLKDNLDLLIDFLGNPVNSGMLIQFKGYTYISKNGSGIAPSVQAFRLITKPLASSDDQWALSAKHTSQPNASPFYIAERLQYAYANGMPGELIMDILDDNDNIVQSLSTVADAANFTYSTDETVWNPLGTIPNVAKTTWLRALVSNPPDGNVRARIRSV